MTDLNDARRPPEESESEGKRNLIVSFPMPAWERFKALVPKGEWNRWIVAAVEARCQAEEGKP